MQIFSHSAFTYILLSRSFGMRDEVIKKLYNIRSNFIFIMQSFMLDAFPKVWREQNPTTYP